MHMQDVSPVLITASAPGDLPPQTGGKALNLARLAQAGFRVPQTLYLPHDAYAWFIREARLEREIEALAADTVDRLRWEEIWDASLALRNAFMRHQVPKPLAGLLHEATARHLGPGPWAARSCAAEEDSGFSHAGMHDSVLDIVGEEHLLRALRQVWASLWSDRAVLYRREMGLDPRASAMGVLLQPMVQGEISGVLFTKNPVDESQMLMEAAHGGAKAVVDDAVESERLLLSRADGRLLRRKAAGAPVVDDALAARLFDHGRRIEELFAAAQDIEWTIQKGEIVILQARPVTTLASPGDANGWKAEDKRPWYLSLTRSHASLLQLKERIEGEILPGMLEESRTMKAVDLATMAARDCQALERELAQRRSRLEYWRDVYWRELIPFAHAVRQFGMLYNDALAPDDPFEFTALLTGQKLLALERNQMLVEMAEMVASDPELAESLRQQRLPEDGPYASKLAAFLESFGDLACSSSWCDEGPWGVIRLTLDGYPGSAPLQAATEAAELETRFLESFAPNRRNFAREVLELARTSYRLRDNDNIYLGRIQARLDEALEQATSCGLEPREAHAQSRDAMPKGLPWQQKHHDLTEQNELQGWAAAAGIARGPARVVTDPRELFSFRKGEVLVCDALDPNMTFVAPLVSAIVERRGGMLVHGAIIAREYGIPCVTGIAEATTRIRTGERLLVDGFRGLVVREQDHVPPVQAEEA